MPPTTKNPSYYYGTGKRKTSIARIRIYKNQGEQISVNGKTVEEVFPWEMWQHTVSQPLEVTNNRGKFRVVALVSGGGVSSQAQAVRHGIARALIAYDENLKPSLKKFGLLTRDSRIKESKKYGLKRARRAPQYTKR